jgi:hypothetical protein
VSDTVALVDEVVSELDTWPGVHAERRSEDLVLVRYEQFELGLLDRARGVAELHFSPAERAELLERGDVDASFPSQGSENVSHDLHGPSDVTAVLELFGRRYRDLRGEDDPASSQEP